MSRRYDDDDDYYRGRGRRPSPPPAGRDRSPDFFYAGGAPPAFASGAMPAPPSQARLQYEPQTPFYPPPPNNNPGLLPPTDSRRPRSMPPPGALVPRHRRSGSRSPSTSSQEHDRPRTPLAKAKHAVKDTFSDSTSGVGVGVLGAIVGGLVAREASEAATRRSKNHHGNNNNSSLISTIVGAAVGGLGANALEKRLEVNRKKGREEQEDWDRKWQPDRAREERRRGRGWDDDDYGEDEVYTYEERRAPRRRSDDRY